MNVFKDEIRALQNPALGAFLQWKFTSAYASKHPQAERPPAILLFVILPILLNRDTFELLSSTQYESGLPKFVAKFTTANQGKSDLLLAIHSRAMNMRELSLKSIQLGIASKLFVLDIGSGRIFPFSDLPPFNKMPTIVDKMGKGADKLGAWFSQVSLADISYYLKVAF